MLAAVLLFTAGPTLLVLDGHDPVLLVSGQKVLGKPELSAKYLRHEYRFATDANRRKFGRDRTKYAVQAGGACGKMGALTGKGSPSRYAVVREQIMLFASDSCRETFLKNEAAYFASPRPMPKFSKVSGERGAEMLAKTVIAHGGAAALQSIKSFNWTIETPYEVAGEKKTWIERWGWQGPGTAFSTNEWDQGMNWFAKTAKASSDGDAKGRWEMHPAEVVELESQILRNPLGLLVQAKGIRAYVTGGGFTAVVGPRRMVVTLDIQGRIAMMSYHDRHAGPFADVSLGFSDYQNVSGIHVPMTITPTVNGKAGTARRIARWEINGPTPLAWQTAWKKS